MKKKARKKYPCKLGYGKNLKIKMRKWQIGRLFVAVCRQKIKNDKQNVEAVIRVKLHVHICNICVTEMCYDALFIFHESIFLIQELVLSFFWH